jgi:glutaminyl-peptide cyclotransferase
MNVKNKALAFLFGSSVLLFGACTHDNNSNNNNQHIADTIHSNANTTITAPPFSADSAYKYLKTQVDFGPRIPGSVPHEKTLNFIVSTLKADSLQVNIQQSSARTFDGKEFKFQNIIASTDPQNQARIVFFTHWDTRPWADLDSVNPDKPFDGADDGASGVGVLLELARHLHKSSPGIGVDLVFVDLEDYGQQSDEDSKYPRMRDSWCLGSQYWAKNLPAGYAPRFGILLDMVGGKNALFPTEGTSAEYAQQIIDKVWNIAAQLGYGNYFSMQKTTPTIDDHLYINKIAGIPTIDIVHYEVERGDYPYFHHRHSDNMSVIDTSTLQVVGNVLMAVIYSEKKSQKP